MNEDDLAVSTTTDGKPPVPGFENTGAPAPIDPRTGQHQAYWVLSEEERKKGFVRPVRRSYEHVGRRPTLPLRDLTEEEQQRYRGGDYVKFEEYPQGTPKVGRFWTQAELDSGCGTVTTMGQALAETYAARPHYYGATFCCGCGVHIPVGADGEFVWEGTDERVGA